MTNIHSLLGELDEAAASGRRALEIATMLRDIPLRILSTRFLEQARYFRGEHEQAVELATDNLAAFPGDRNDEQLGHSPPSSAFNRQWLVLSLPTLRRFHE